MNWHSQAGKSGLIKMLMKQHGLSKRKAEKAVKAVFDGMAGALQRGEPVELPVGWVQAVSQPLKRKLQVQKFRNIQSRETFFRPVRPPARIIRFRPRPELIVKGSEPSSPTLRKDEPVAELFRSLMGVSREVSPEEFKYLMAAAESNLDFLVSRLRELAREERRFFDFFTLCATVRQLYWVRG